MQERPKGFLSQEKIDHDSEVFDYISELHNYLWKFVDIANPGVSGNLQDQVDAALERLEPIRKFALSISSEHHGSET